MESTLNLTLEEQFKIASYNLKARNLNREDLKQLVIETLENYYRENRKLKIIYFVKSIGKFYENTEDKDIKETFESCIDRASKEQLIELLNTILNNYIQLNKGYIQLIKGL
jgi:glutamyl-tRNA reductase